jgi:hypothetical protein
MDRMPACGFFITFSIFPRTFFLRLPYGRIISDRNNIYFGRGIDRDALASRRNFFLCSYLSKTYPVGAPEAKRT